MATSILSVSPPPPVRPVPPARSRVRLALRDAARAFYCQMYYWGRDVLHPGGNLLVRYGFERIPRRTREGTSRYRLMLEDGLLELHGFCAGWYPADPEDGPGLCFDRKHDTWRPWPHSTPPGPETIRSGQYRMMPGDAEDPGTLLASSARFARWLAGYEAWALRQWGTAARQDHHRDFVRLRGRRWWLPPDLSLQWLRAYAAAPLLAPRPKTLSGRR